LLKVPLHALTKSHDREDGQIILVSALTCETNANDCASNPCQNGGTCADAVGAFSCACAPGFSGSLCELNVDDCAVNPCLNGAICGDGINAFTCLCQPGFSGSRCQTNIDDCAANPCFNGGRCLDGINSFACDCADTGFNGQRCQSNVNDCTAASCFNGGLCQDGIRSFTCDCTGTGFNGQRCENNINDCSTSSCLNGGRCVDGVRAVTCNCGGTGFQGPRCESNVNDCSASSCSNGGRCIDQVNGVACDCTNTGFEGSTCQNNVNACMGRVCNSGVCVDGTGPGAFTCDCRGTGFSGDRCELNVNACAATSCRNGGRCIDGTAENEFTCDCSGTGFGGRFCETPSLRGNGQSCDAEGQCQSGHCVLAETQPHGGICCIEDCADGQFCRVTSVSNHQCIDCAADQNECPTGCGRDGFCNPTLANGIGCTEDESCTSGSCVLHYSDGDDDEFAVAAATTSRFCAGGTFDMPGFTTRQPGAANATDCQEGNANVFPGQTREFATRAAGKTTLPFDYNCDGQQLSASTTFNRPTDCADATRGECNFRNGWAPAGAAPEAVGVPACGEQGYISSCQIVPPSTTCGNFSGGPVIRPCR
jgi:EGF-like domain/Human growth factor-like EGF